MQRIKKVWERVREKRNLTVCDVAVITYTKLLKGVIQDTKDFVHFGAFWQTLSTAHRSGYRVDFARIHKEITSVIMGSETAAYQGKPLAETQYLEEATVDNKVSRRLLVNR